MTIALVSVVLFRRVCCQFTLRPGLTGWTQRHYCWTEVARSILLPRLVTAASAAETVLRSCMCLSAPAMPAAADGATTASLCHECEALISMVNVAWCAK